MYGVVISGLLLLSCTSYKHRYQLHCRAAFRIFIQGGRNGFPRNVGGADGYPCANELGGSGGMPPKENFAILSIQRSLLVSFRGGLFYLFCIKGATTPLYVS